MPGGVGAGFTEPGWRPPGWRGLTGLNEPSYNGGGAQRAGRLGTTDLSLYPNGSFGAIFGFTFGTLFLSKVQKHQLTDFTEEKCLIYYRGFFKRHNLP